MSQTPQIFDFPDLEFFAELDKITSPKPCLDANELLRKERLKTEKLKSSLLQFRESSKKLVVLYNSEHTKNQELEAALTETKEELSVQKQDYTELENTTLNKLHYQEQLLEEFRSKKHKSSEDHVELAKEYLELLSEITRYQNYAIDNTRIKIVRKVESFMRTEDPTFKPKIIKSRGKKKNGSVSDYETDSMCSMSTTSSVSKKKRTNPVTDDWDRLSVSSLKSFDRFDDSMLNSPSSDYSVGMNINEDSDIPSFVISETKKTDQKPETEMENKENPDVPTFKPALLHNYCLKNKSPPKPQRKSQNNLQDTFDLNISELNPQIEEIIDQNLNENEELPDLDFSSIFQTFSSEEIVEATSADFEEIEEVTETENEETLNKPCNCQNSKKIVVTKTIATNTDNRFLQLPDCPVLDEVNKTTCSKSTNTITRPTTTKSISTDPVTIGSEEVKVVKEDRGSSPIKIKTRDQAITVKFPSVTRGTTTESPKSKSIGCNFPEPTEFSVNQIMQEMLIDIPELIEPIEEVKHTLKSTYCQTSPVKQNSIKTITDLQNVRKGLDYVDQDDSLSRVKKESLSPATSFNNLFFPRNPKTDRIQDDHGFSVIGHAMYDIFVDLIQQRNLVNRNDIVSGILEGLNRFRENSIASPADSGCGSYESEFEGSINEYRHFNQARQVNVNEARALNSEELSRNGRDFGVGTEDDFMEDIANSRSIQLQVNDARTQDIQDELSHEHAANNDEYFNVSEISDSNSEGSPQKFKDKNSSLTTNSSVPRSNHSNNLHTESKNIDSIQIEISKPIVEIDSQQSKESHEKSKNSQQSKGSIENLENTEINEKLPDLPSFFDGASISLHQSESSKIPETAVKINEKLSYSPNLSSGSSTKSIKISNFANKSIKYLFGDLDSSDSESEEAESMPSILYKSSYRKIREDQPLEISKSAEKFNVLSTSDIKHQPYKENSLNIQSSRIESTQETIENNEDVNEKLRSLLSISENSTESMDHQQSEEPLSSSEKINVQQLDLSLSESSNDSFTSQQSEKSIENSENTEKINEKFSDLPIFKADSSNESIEKLNCPKKSILEYSDSSDSENDDTENITTTLKSLSSSIKEKSSAEQSNPPKENGELLKSPLYEDISDTSLISSSPSEIENSKISFNSNDSTKNSNNLNVSGINKISPDSSDEDDNESDRGLHSTKQEESNKSLSKKELFKDIFGDSSDDDQELEKNETLKNQGVPKEAGNYSIFDENPKTSHEPQKLTEDLKSTISETSSAIGNNVVESQNLTETPSKPSKNETLDEIFRSLSEDDEEKNVVESENSEKGLKQPNKITISEIQENSLTNIENRKNNSTLMQEVPPSIRKLSQTEKVAEINKNILTEKQTKQDSQEIQSVEKTPPNHRNTNKNQQIFQSPSSNQKNHEFLKPSPFVRRSSMRKSFAEVEYNRIREEIRSYGDNPELLSPIKSPVPKRKFKKVKKDYNLEAEIIETPKLILLDNQTKNQEITDAARNKTNRRISRVSLDSEMKNSLQKLEEIKNKPINSDSKRRNYKVQSRSPHTRQNTQFKKLRKDLNNLKRRSTNTSTPKSSSDESLSILSSINSQSRNIKKKPNIFSAEVLARSVKNPNLMGFLSKKSESPGISTKSFEFPKTSSKRSNLSKSLTISSELPGSSTQSTELPDFLRKSCELPEALIKNPEFSDSSTKSIEFWNSSTKSPELLKRSTDVSSKLTKNLNLKTPQTNASATTKRITRSASKSTEMQNTTSIASNIKLKPENSSRFQEKTSNYAFLDDAGNLLGFGDAEQLSGMIAQDVFKDRNLQNTFEGSLKSKRFRKNSSPKIRKPSTSRALFTENTKETAFRADYAKIFEVPSQNSSEPIEDFKYYSPKSPDFLQEVDSDHEIIEIPLESKETIEILHLEESLLVKNSLKGKRKSFSRINSIEIPSKLPRIQENGPNDPIEMPSTDSKIQESKEMNWESMENQLQAEKNQKSYFQSILNFGDCPADTNVEEPELENIENLEYIPSDTPSSPPPFENPDNHIPIEIPLQPQVPVALRTQKTNTNEEILKFRPEIHRKLHQKLEFDKSEEKSICAIRKKLKVYLTNLCNEENLQICVKDLRRYLKNPKLLVASIWETLEDHLTEEVCYEYTPPAPPLPPHQQKLILVVQRLASENPDIPKMFLDHLESAVFRLDDVKHEILYLENMVYFWTALVDLFFDGDRNMILLFIYKCLYFLDYKAIPMVFIVIKAYPDAVPTKAQLLNSYNKDVDWTSMDHFEVGRTNLDLNRIDPLILTIIYYLTNTKCYHIKHKESYPMRNNELYRFFSKRYNFWPNFLTPHILLKILMQHIQENRLDNISFGLILFSKRNEFKFRKEEILERNLVPLLKNSIKVLNETEARKISVLIETISCISKCFKPDSQMYIKEIFQLFVEILHKCQDQEVQEDCVRGMLRIHRLHGDLREIFRIIKEWNSQFEISSNLKMMISTFVNRKSKTFFVGM